MSLLHVPYDPTCGFTKVACVLAAVNSTANDRIIGELALDVGHTSENLMIAQLLYKENIEGKPCLFAATLVYENGIHREAVVKFQCATGSMFIVLLLRRTKRQR